MDTEQHAVEPWDFLLKEANILWLCKKNREKRQEKKFSRFSKWF